MKVSEDNPKRVLVVDDEVDVCLLLRRFLRRSGQEVACGHSLKDAMFLLDTWHPDVLILDNNLPDGTGMNALASICSSYPDTQVIMISAMELREKALDEGASDFLEKPVDLHRLNSLVNTGSNFGQPMA